MDAIDDELREIKREIVESRGLVIKTNNLANGLAADLKSISKKQTAYEGRVFYATTAGYALFVSALLVVVYVAWNARVEASKQLDESAKAQIKTAQDQVKQAADEAQRVSVVHEDVPHDEDELKFAASPPAQPRRYALGSLATSPNEANIEWLLGKCISFHWFCDHEPSFCVFCQWVPKWQFLPPHEPQPRLVPHWYPVPTMFACGPTSFLTLTVADTPGQAFE